MHDELVRTLALVPDGTFNYVTCAGLWGTYDDGLEWLKRPENADKPKAILSMGSSIGNFTPGEAVDFIAQFASELGPEDVMLIALDGCQDADKVYHAYNVSSVDYTTVNGQNSTFSSPQIAVVAVCRLPEQ